MSKLLISPSPHVHSVHSTSTLMRDVLIALCPAVLVSIILYGLPFVLILAVSIGASVLTEYLIERHILGRKSTVSDFSAAVTGCLLALNLPPCAPWWIAIVGSVFAIGVVKMTFGGLGQNIFNPAIAARVFLLVSFPVIMTDWAVPDAFSGATPLGAIAEGGAAPTLGFKELLLYKVGGSAGEASALALLAGFIYLLVRRVITATIPVTILGTVAVFSGIMHLVNPELFTGPLFNIFNGGLLLGAIFMATDYVTSPMTVKGQIIFGVGIGLITMLIRYFGAYPEGVSFAILIMNCTVPLINKYCKPRRFGEVRK